LEGIEQRKGGKRRRKRLRRTVMNGFRLPSLRDCAGMTEGWGGVGFCYLIICCYLCTSPSPNPSLREGGKKKQREMQKSHPQITQLREGDCFRGELGFLVNIVICFGNAPQHGRLPSVAVRATRRCARWVNSGVVEREEEKRRWKRLRRIFLNGFRLPSLRDCAGMTVFYEGW